MAAMVDTALAEAARSGDVAALDAVAAQCLPLVYSIVRRSLRSSSDVDDVVQDVMLNVVRGLGSLRDPDRLRAWLAAVTVNQIRAYLRSGYADSFAAADRFELDQLDPGSEFVGHTLLRLDLSEQRRETARATLWLDPEHRDLLGLWWLEACGQLSRAELTAALGLDPHLVTVRIGRMKEQLEGCRQVLRALDAGCPGLRELAADWPGETSSVWRKRFLRHIRACRRCLGAADGLIPPERLLAGLPLLALPLGYLGTMPGTATAAATGSVTGTGTGSGIGTGSGSTATKATLPHPAPARHGARHRAGSHGSGAGGSSGTGFVSLLGKPVGLAALVLSVVGVAAVVLLVVRPAPSTSASRSLPTGQPVGGAGSLASAGSVIVPSVLASQGPGSSAASPTHAANSSASPSARATRTAAAIASSASVSGTDQSPAEQVLAVINRARAAAGLPPYTMSTGLIESATAHNNLMAGGCGLTHQCPGEPAIGDRVTAAGVDWTACGENIGEGGPEPDTAAALARMAVGLTNSMLAEQPPNDGHRLNILSSSYTEVGIAVTIDSSGTVWLTQDFAN